MSQCLKIWAIKSSVHIQGVSIIPTTSGPISILVWIDNRILGSLSHIKYKDLSLNYDTLQ